MAETNTTSVRTIKVVVDTSGAPGLKAIADGMAGVNRNTKNTSDTMGIFKNAFLGAFAALRVRDLAAVSDTMQQLFDRISVLSGGTTQAKAVFEQLVETANRTRTSIDSIATVYARVAAATRSLNLSSQQTIAITELLQNSFRLSGATSEEAANGTIQFTQALALGVLRGQDFKSVLSQNVVLGDILAKGLAGGRGELQKMAEAGKLVNSFVLPKLFEAMEETNKSAKELGTTFGQTVTVSLNLFKAKILEINKEFNLSGEFAQGMKFFIENLKIFIPILSTLVLIPVALWIKGIGVALLALNPYLLAASALFATVAIGVLHYKEISETLTEVIYKKRTAQLSSNLAASQAFDAQLKAAGASQKVIDVNEKETKSIIDKMEALDRVHLAKQRETITDLKRKDDLLLTAKRLASEPPKSFGGTEPEPEIRREELIYKLNRAFLAGKVSVTSYYEQLEKLDRQLETNQFKAGKEDLEKFNKEMEKLTIQEWNRNLKQGTISMEEFNEKVEQSQIQQLNNQLDAGKISLLEYDAALVKISTRFESNSVLRTGAEAYIKSVGTLGQQIAGAITQTFSSLEDTFVQFTKTGKVNFTDFAQAVLDDLNRIIIRSLIIAPLAKGILNFAAGGDSVQIEGATQGAPSKQFAAGGVFDSPTTFGYGGGKTGLLGEAGPEAIVPLSRNSSGELGIKSSTAPVYVNIVNNSGGDVEQSESTGPGGEKTLEIIIHGKVRDGIASGKFDKSFQTAFGLNRRGV